MQPGFDNHLCTRELATVELGFGDFETNIDILTKEKELIEPLIPKEENNTNDNN